MIDVDSYVDVSTPVIRSRGPSKQISFRKAVDETLAGLDLTAPALAPKPETAVLPGELASTKALERLRMKMELVQLIASMEFESISWWSDVDARLAPRTVALAKRLIALLPDNKALPTISSSYEGGLILKWRGANGITLLTIEDGHLHLVQNATTNQASYYDYMRFTDEDPFPRIVLQSIPFS